MVLIGFIFIAAPLVAAVITGAVYVDKLTNQSQEAISRAVKATQLSRLLLQQTSVMERNFRQYLVLGNTSLLESYFDRHEIYQETANQLTEITIDESLKEQLKALTNLEILLYERLLAKVQEDDKTEVNSEDYITLTEVAKAILTNSNKAIDIELGIMNSLSNEAQNIIFWELMALLPFTAIFMGVFTSLLSKPIRQMDTAIRQLGEGEFEKQIEVSGPSDIEFLGERLDWLRLRLKYLENKKVKFLQFVSHELKTPLTAIREGADLLSDGVTGQLTQNQRDVSDILKGNSIKLQKMIEKLLSFNMPEDAKLYSGYSKIRVNKVIENVLADHQPVLLAKNIRIIKRCEDWQYLGDEEQFRVIVDNIVSNAVKYTPDNGRISISLQKLSDEIVLDVEDSGPGIDESHRAKIFDAFYQGAAPEKGLIQGSGLGLSIVKEFVNAHDGKIELVSGDKSSGAHLRVSLPTGNGEKELAWAV